jgi:hypothetical protein
MQYMTVSVREYSDVLREKQRQLQDFRRFITLQSPGTFIKDKLGADLAFIREWISAMFTEEMSWQNYGSVWVIDHIVPFRMFDLFNEEDVLICWNYRNLMPLLDKDNLKKQGNVFFAFELLFERRAKDSFYQQLFDRIRPEVEWMAKYIDNYDKLI